ncbi:MAG: hypothetical protein IKK29_06290 [Christensenellaceae bacterium]|nr:hypothetical protein [Christensenellaceae bacterium]
MEAYTTFRIRLKSNNTTNELFEIIKNTIDNYEKYMSERDGIKFLNDFEIDETQRLIHAEDSCSLDSETFADLIPQIAKNIATNVKDCEYDVNAYYTSCNCGFEAYHGISYKENILNIKSVFSEEGNGFCEDCGETFVYIDEIDEQDYEKEFICRKCGEKHTFNELFFGCPPEIMKSTYEIVDENLILISEIAK